MQTFPLLIFLIAELSKYLFRWLNLGFGIRGFCLLSFFLVSMVSSFFYVYTIIFLLKFIITIAVEFYNDFPLFFTLTFFILPHGFIT